MFRRPVIYLVLAAFALSAQWLPRANAQTLLHRLTTTGDVMEFVWAPRGDALYVTRTGDVLALSDTRAQVTGNLYRVTQSDGQSELLVQNANTARPAPSGDEIAFTRLAEDGRARVLSYAVKTKQTRHVDAVSWGALPQWNHAGDALYYTQNGNLARMTRSEQHAVVAENIPPDARVSPAGDRFAYVDADGLVVFQNNVGRVMVSNPGDTRVLPQLAWSNAGDKLAYFVTHDNVASELWIADTTRNTTQKIAQGELEYFANAAWSPDDAFVVFTRTPTGSSVANASEIWRARADGSELRALTNNQAQEALPQYAPDGNAIAFLRDGDMWVMDLNVEGLPVAPNVGAQNMAVDYKTPRSPTAQRTPPTSIRVQHDAINTCRSAPIGQIDTLDFETYVKRVVPAEVFSTWDAEALKTQAVAARSYAWFWILQHYASSFDVTDSTAYQNMCDTRLASTDAATDDTRGQYLDYAGYMVFAAYGAENGDPTLTNTWGNPYLLGVDDPVGFGKTRAGNGLGYSQWGAQRWATLYDWTYQQILRHYYSNVTLETSAGEDPDIVARSAAIVLPRTHWGVTSNQVHIVVNASGDTSGVSSIALNAQYFDGAATQNKTIATLNGSAREYIWDVSALPDQGNITLTPTVYTSVNTAFTAQGVTFFLDRTKPTGTVSAPASTPTRNVTLTLNASDANNGLSEMAFSNDWIFEGENQSVQSNSGSVVNDANALNGQALRGLAGTNVAGLWYGPYTSVLPAQKTYRAYFRLKTDNAATSAVVAKLDAVIDGGSQYFGGANTLGLKVLRGTDFKTANAYQEFYVDFVYNGYTSGALELRVTYTANASLWLDRILVVSTPVPYASSADWTLSSGYGNKRVIAKFIDSAGNSSNDTGAEIFYGVVPTPTPVLTPRARLPLIVREK